MKRIALLFIILALAGCKETGAETTTPPDDGTGLGDTFDFDRLVIVNDTGKRLDFDIYLALTRSQQSQGLMHIRQLPERTGMLFVYDEPGIRSMWMKNTYIPLDLIFIGADGKVSSIVYNATPLTLASRSSTEPVQYVLELKGGSAIRFDIGTDSHIIWGGDDALLE